MHIHAKTTNHINRISITIKISQPFTQRTVDFRFFFFYSFSLFAVAHHLPMQIFTKFFPFHVRCGFGKCWNLVSVNQLNYMHTDIQRRWAKCAYLLTAFLIYVWMLMLMQSISKSDSQWNSMKTKADFQYFFLAPFVQK